MASNDRWHEGRLVGFDLETTGVEPEDARIVTAAIAQCGAGLATESLTLVADPGIEIPDEAAAIHGYTTERARAEGQPAGDVVGVVLDLLALQIELGRPVVDFNARFDLTILDREARRHGHVPLCDRPGELRVIDPLVIDKHLHRYRKGSRKLDAQCAHYGAVLGDAHQADSDAVAACRVGWCIGERGRVIRRVRNHREAHELAVLEEEWRLVRHDLDLLHGAQVRWAHDEAVRLAEYFREQGNPDADRVQTEWPFVPLASAEAAAA